MLLSALILGLTLAAGVVTHSDSSPSERFEPCGDGIAALVSATAAKDFADVCQGATAALQFFEEHGVVPSSHVRIAVTQERPAPASSSATGWYIEGKRLGYVVPYAVFRTSRTWFGVGIDRSMYRMMAAHEAAHAIAHSSFRISDPTIQAKEYLAYIAAFASMPSDLRSRTLRDLAPEKWSS